MSHILLGIYLFLLLVLIKRSKFFQSEQFDFKIVGSIFLIKFIAGISLYFVYVRFYGSRISGDIFKYFDDGTIIYSALRENPIDYLRMVTGIGSDAPHLIKYYDTCHFWIKDFNYGLLNDNRIVIRFNALIRLISMGNIHIHTLFISFLSFTGLWYLFKLFETEFRTKKWGLLLAIFFFPSALFWTSGLLKEGILTFAFGMMLYHWNQVIGKFYQPRSWLLLAFAIFILMVSKFYVLVAALPGMLSLLAIKNLKTKNQMGHFIWVHVLLIIMLWFSKPIIGLDFPKIIAQKQNDFINYVNSMPDAGSKIAMDKLEPTFFDLVGNAPHAFITTLFRPTIFEIHNAMSLLAALENLIILGLLIGTLLYFNKTHLKNPLLWFSISFTVILFILSGLTTPILGALVRYKAPALPFLGIIILYLTKDFNCKKSSIQKKTKDKSLVTS